MGHGIPVTLLLSGHGFPAAGYCLAAGFAAKGRRRPELPRDSPSLEDMPVRLPQEVFFAGIYGQIQCTVQGIDGKPVSVGLSPRRFRAGVPVPSVSDPLNGAAEGENRFPGGNGLRDDGGGRDIPDHPMGKRPDGVAQILQRDCKGFGVRGQVLKGKRRREILAPPGICGAKLSLAVNSGAPELQTGFRGCRLLWYCRRFESRRNSRINLDRRKCCRR